MAQVKLEGPMQQSLPKRTDVPIGKGKVDLRRCPVMQGFSDDSPVFCFRAPGEALGCDQEEAKSGQTIRRKGAGENRVAY